MNPYYSGKANDTARDAFRDVLKTTTHLVLCDGAKPIQRLPVTERFHDGQPAPATYYFTADRDISDPMVALMCGDEVLIWMHGAEFRVTWLRAGDNLLLDFTGVSFEGDK
jgi:hypothetical protein